MMLYFHFKDVSPVFNRQLLFSLEHKLLLKFLLEIGYKKWFLN